MNTELPSLLAVAGIHLVIAIRISLFRKMQQCSKTSIAGKMAVSECM